MNRATYLVVLVLVAALAGSTGGALAATADDAPSAIDVPTAATNNTTDETNTTATNNTTDETNTTATNNTTDETNTTYSTVSSTCSYPFTSTDATGTNVTVEGAPKRIVVVGPSATQTLWEIGAQNRVVGLWDSSYTAYLDNASAKPNVASSLGKADVASVVNQSPDMVLMANIQKDDAVQKLRQGGVATYKFEGAESIEDIYAKTRLIGHLSGNCAGAEDTVSWMQDRLDTVAEVRDRADGTPTIFYPMAGSYTAGSGTFITDLMRLGGTHNVALDAGITGYKPYSEGFMLKQSPRWLLATYSLPEHGEAQSLLPETQEIRESAAYREDRVVAVNANYVSQPAPRVVYVIEDIAEAVHPDAWAAVHGTGSVPDDDDDDDVDWEDLHGGNSSNTAANATTNATSTNGSVAETAANASAIVSLTRANGSVTATVRNATGTVSFDLVNHTVTNVTAVNTTTANATTNVSAMNASANATATNATATTSAAATGLTGASVSLRAGVNAGELSFTASDPSAAAPNATPALNASNTTPMQYFTANVSGVDPDEIDNATIRFRVAPADLPNGTEPADVALHRYHNASWSTLPTEHLNGSAYAATTPGFSAFAIGSTNATAAESETTTNETTTSNATTSTAGSQNGTSTVTNATTTAATSTTSTSSGSSPGFGPAVAALAFALAAYLLRRR